MKIHFQLAVFVIVIALLWGVEDFVRLCEGPSSKQKKYGSFDYQQCAGNAEQTLIGNGRNWTAEKSKILKFAVLKLPHIAFGISGFCFLKASPRCHWAVLSLYKFVFLICWGRKCKWNEFFHSRLKTKCCQAKFHYYEVVFKADDDLQGLRTERAHFSSPFHLAILST